jgi:Transposase DNA-binding/Transposase Tn5 dimerisation domain
MNTTFDEAHEWAEREFGGAKLGDRRRARRVVQVAARLVRCPSGTLPSALRDWKELKGAYRLFSNQVVSHPALLEAHCQRTLRECRQPGEYLLIEDRTCLDYSSHRAARGLGRIGNDRGAGFLLHTTLAVKMEGDEAVSVVGLLGQSCWARTGTSARAKKERWRQRVSRARESEYWAGIFSQLEGVPAPSRWIYIADRESDIYEVFERCGAGGVDFIVRAQFERALGQEDRSVFEAVASAPVVGRFELALRTRGELPARNAQLEVRACRVRLRGVWRPGGMRPDLEVNVIEVKEAGPTGIHWILLTSLSCASFAECRGVAARYARRWLIEEYHKALKSGANVEASQLESAAGLQALLGILAVVAVRLLNFKLLARSEPRRKVGTEMLGAEELALLRHEFGEPPEGWTYGSVLIATARMGGFLARTGDGFPGWLTIWRGWQRLALMAQGVRTLQSSDQL